ncbi:MAG: helix-turn-helix domain-containing protein [Spirochaetales bacterium]
MDIGKSLKTIRQLNKLTQSELALKTNIKQQNISRWEANIHMPNIEECIKLADFYGVSLDELIDRIIK